MRDLPYSQEFSVVSVSGLVRRPEARVGPASGSYQSSLLAELGFTPPLDTESSSDSVSTFMRTTVPSPHHRYHAPASTHVSSSLALVPTSPLQMY